MRASRTATLSLGAAAVALGAAFLWNVGALPGMATRNVAAFLVGLLAGWGTHKLAHLRHGAAALFTLATIILALILSSGIEVDGVRRWLAIGPLHLQPALILAPLLLAIAAGREGRHWRFAILLPLLLVALQPDTATMLALAVGTAAFLAAASIRSTRGWTARRIALATGAGCIAVIALVVAGIRTPPPVAFVEGTIEIARLGGGVAIVLHLLAATVMIAALLAGGGPIGVALAAYFATAALVAAFWAFPMPVVGAGPSHLVGFGLAIGWLAERHAITTRGNLLEKPDQ